MHPLRGIANLKLWGMCRLHTGEEHACGLGALLYDIRISPGDYLNKRFRCTWIKRETQRVMLARR